ncbi:MAG: hypothetical protein NTV94_00295 [Planctomycetota bacterium]|nr:hypothetical protein [Planctomycetota bacterium]
MPEGRQTAFIHAARCDRYGDVYLTICVEGLDDRVKRTATIIASRLASRPHEVMTCMDGDGSFVGVPMLPSRGEWSVDADVDFGKSDKMMKVDWFDSKQPEVSRRGRKWFCRGIVKLPMPMKLTPGTSMGFFSQSSEYTWYLADEFVFDTTRVQVAFADK